MQGEKMIETKIKKPRHSERLVIAVETIAGKLDSIEKFLKILVEGNIAKKKGRAKRPMDENRKKVMDIIKKMRADGKTYDDIAIFLGKEKLQTFSNRGKWHAQTVHRLYQDHIAP